MGEAYDVLRYHVVPPLFLVFFTGVVQVMALWGRGEAVTVAALATNAVGDAFSWAAVGVLVLWAFLWLHVPGPLTRGPPSPTGYVPTYKDNGVVYYVSSVAAVALVLWWRPSLATALHEAHPRLLGSLNALALLLCLWLLLRGKKACPEEPPRPLAYEFYRGMELHPRLLGCDVKQLTNCRVGLMAWQLLIVAFFVAGGLRNGFCTASFVNLLLQSIYLAKFFWWEAGYFHTLDITLDRAGYYICWGCLVWVPCLYTFSSYYLVAHPPQVGWGFSALLALVGDVCIWLNYEVDLQKQIFRNAKDGKCQIWGKPAQFMVAEYRDASGRLRQSRLLLSGFWGQARHLNYTFEIVATLAWSLPGWGQGHGAFLYFYFVTALLLHRTFRDEEKCAAKYGDHWSRYCRQVPYRFIPYIF